MTTLTLRISEETNAALDALADATERSKSYLAQRAIEEYLSLNAWQVQAIGEGIEAAEAGRLVDHAQVRQRWEQRLADSLDQGS
jgi:predicted transcriptional regulator